MTKPEKNALSRIERMLALLLSQRDEWLGERAVRQMIGVGRTKFHGFSRHDGAKLRVHAGTKFALVRKRIGGRWRYSRNSVLRHLETCQTEGAGRIEP